MKENSTLSSPFEKFWIIVQTKEYESGTASDFSIEIFLVLFIYHLLQHFLDNHESSFRVEHFIENWSEKAFFWNHAINQLAVKLMK